jgi:hypothetical protein
VPIALCLLALALAAPSPGPVTERPKLLVSDLVAQGVAPADAAAFTDAVVGALESRGVFQVLSSKDVRDILSAQRRRELTGACQANSPECANALGNALGARFVLTGSLSQLGETYELALQMLDTVKGERKGQSSRLAKDLTTLRLLVPYAAAEAAGTPLPPPPSRVLQYSAIVSGAALVVAGGFLGMVALSQEKTLNDELCPGGASGGRCTGTNLRPLSFYQSQNTLIGHQKTIGLSMMLGGAALAAAGLYLMPPPEGGPRIALVPQLGGVAVVGELR